MSETPTRNTDPRMSTSEEETPQRLTRAQYRESEAAKGKGKTTGKATGKATGKTNEGKL